ncbi:MAG: L-threonylcarbamoyladenylate synthase [Pseudomonadota bacterium]
MSGAHALSRFQQRWLGQALADDAVVAYPTEGVFGLGCSAHSNTAVGRVIDVKGRAADKGLILLAADAAALTGWAELAGPLPATGSIEAPLTWIVKAGPLATDAITGGRPTVAVRITHHPIAAALCRASPAPLISTSANRSGQPAITQPLVLQRQFRRTVDVIVPGQLGPANGPSEIRDLASGRVLRPAGV